MLSISAFNALLKILEEPPAHVIFILATTEIHKLPATILSRCQRFDFRRIAPEDIAARLQYVCEQENASIAPDAAILIARIADGALRDALNLLERCLTKQTEVTVEVVSQAAGIADRSYLFTLCDYIAAAAIPQALEVLHAVYTASCDMEQLCHSLLFHFRDLMLVKTLRSARNLLVCTPQEFEQLQAQSERFALEALLRGIRLLEETLSAMKQQADRRIVMEVTVIKLCSPAQDPDARALAARVSLLEQKVQALQQAGTIAAQTTQTVIGAPAQPEPTPAPSQPAPVPAAEDSSAQQDAFFMPVVPKGREADAPPADIPAPPEAAPEETDFFMPVVPKARQAQEAPPQEDAAQEDFFVPAAPKNRQQPAQDTPAPQEDAQEDFFVPAAPKNRQQPAQDAPAPQEAAQEDFFMPVAPKPKQAPAEPEEEPFDITSVNPPAQEDFFIPAVPKARAAEKTTSEETPPAAQASADAAFNWEAVLLTLQKTDAPLYGMLASSKATLQNNVCRIASDNTMAQALLAQNTHKQALEAALQQVAGFPCTFHFGIEAEDAQITLDPMHTFIEKLASFEDADGKD